MLNMRCVFLCLIQLCCLSATSIGQIPVANYQEFKIIDVGSILVPTTMELQAGAYKEYSDAAGAEAQKKLGYEVSGDKIVFQQKGLNEFNNFNTYARIIIDTDRVKLGGLGRLKSKIVISRSELNLLDRSSREQFEKMFSANDIRLIRWDGVSLVTLNGQNAIRIAYIRQLGKNPAVFVEVFRFQNYDRSHSLTISYRQQDAALWSDSLTRAKNSFTITNVR